MSAGQPSLHITPTNTGSNLSIPNITKGRESPGSVEIYGDLHPNDRLMLKSSDEVGDGDFVSVR